MLDSRVSAYQHVLRQNQSVGGSDHHVGIDFFEHLQGFDVVAQFSG